MSSQSLLDVTITAVDLSKAFVNWLTFRSNDSTSGLNGPLVNLLNSTTLRMQRDWTGPNVYVSWEVVEFV